MSALLVQIVGRFKMFKTIKEILTAREPGCGYFGGAEGAIRFVLFYIIAGIFGTIYLILVA